MTVERMNRALSLRAKGKNISEIARELSCNRSTVYDLLSGKPPKTTKKNRSPIGTPITAQFMCLEDFEDLQDRSGFSVEQLYRHAGVSCPKYHSDALVKELSAEAVNKMFDLMATTLGEREVKRRRPLGPRNQRIRELWNTTHKGRPLSIAVRVGCDSSVVYDVLGLVNPAVEPNPETANADRLRRARGHQWTKL